jgi:hypothetical protein
MNETRTGPAPQHLLLRPDAFFGAVALVDDNGSEWRPKEVFHALAAAYRR